MLKNINILITYLLKRDPLNVGYNAGNGETGLYSETLSEIHPKICSE